MTTPDGFLGAIFAIFVGTLTSLPVRLQGPPEKICCMGKIARCTLFPRFHVFDDRTQTSSDHVECCDGSPMLPHTRNTGVPGMGFRSWAKGGISNRRWGVLNVVCIFCGQKTATPTLHFFQGGTFTDPVESSAETI